MPRCTAELRTEKKPSENRVHSLHIFPEPDTFNCHLWTRRQPHHHPTHAPACGGAHCRHSSPESLRFLLVPQSCHRDTIVPGAAGPEQEERKPPAEKRLTAEKAAGSRALARGRSRLLTIIQEQSQQLQLRSKDGLCSCGRKNTLIKNKHAISATIHRLLCSALPSCVGSLKGNTTRANPEAKTRRKRNRRLLPSQAGLTLHSPS